MSKLMIASDIHGSAYYCRKMLECYEKENANRLLLLGDILYHGPRNDLPKNYDPKEVIKLLNGHAKEIYCVRGNCDSEVDQMVLDFPIMADYMLLEENNHMVYVTHGHIYNKDTFKGFKSGDILLHGHTHIPSWENFGDNNLYLNPGSISIPKGDSTNSYMTLEDNIFTWKDIEGEEYHKLTI